MPPNEPCWYDHAPLSYHSMMNAKHVPMFVDAFNERILNHNHRYLPTGLWSSIALNKATSISGVHFKSSSLSSILRVKIIIDYAYLLHLYLIYFNLIYFN